MGAVSVGVLVIVPVRVRVRMLHCVRVGMLMDVLVRMLVVRMASACMLVMVMIMRRCESPTERGAHQSGAQRVPPARGVVPVMMELTVAPCVVRGKVDSSKRQSEVVRSQVAVQGANIARAVVYVRANDSRDAVVAHASVGMVVMISRPAMSVPKMSVPKMSVTMAVTVTSGARMATATSGVRVAIVRNEPVDASVASASVGVVVTMAVMMTVTMAVTNMVIEIIVGLGCGRRRRGYRLGADRRLRNRRGLGFLGCRDRGGRRACRSVLDSFLEQSKFDVGNVQRPRRGARRRCCGHHGRCRA